MKEGIAKIQATDEELYLGWCSGHGVTSMDSRAILDFGGDMLGLANWQGMRKTCKEESWVTPEMLARTTVQMVLFTELWKIREGLTGLKLTFGRVNFEVNVHQTCKWT